MKSLYSITKDRIPTHEEPKLIVYSCDAQGKALIIMLASSGMRIGEALALRVRDVDLTKRPARVYLRSEVTKDRQGRWCFISDEAAEFLRSYLGERINAKDAYIFQGRHQGVSAEGARYPRGRWKNEPQPEMRSEGRPEGDPKKIVSEEELERYIAEGWDFQTVLPSGRILISKLQP